jgi:cytochrome d ubiquinol oxidase subunit II
VLINTIGPVWDGNEVWLLVAGGATFAAFPEWYATLFSGSTCAVPHPHLPHPPQRVAFEYRGKRDSATWRARWDWAIVVGSALPALLFGVAFGNIVSGMAMGHDRLRRRSALSTTWATCSTCSTRSPSCSGS